MSSLFSTHRRAEEFARAVDRDGPVTSELSALAALATALREQAPVEPRPEAVTDLRSRLMIEAETALVPGERLALPARRTPRERRLVAGATVAVVLAGSGSMAFAAQGALPGDTLYPVKRGLERAQAGLSVSSAGRGHDLLGQADDRLAEVAGLLGSGEVTDAPQVPRTLDAFRSQAQEGADLLLRAYQDGRDPEDVVAVRDFAADHNRLLQELARTAPPGTQDELAAAAVTLRDIDTRARELCASCAEDLPGIEVPALLLSAAEVDRALNQADAGALDNSHPFLAPKDTAGGGSGSTDPEDGTAGSTGAGPDSTGPGDGALLPGGTGTSGPGDAAAELQEDVNRGVDNLAEGLGGAVETILPDTGPLLP